MNAAVRKSLSLLFVAALTSCGGGRELVSISIAPAVADAQSFSSGQVQFVATGTYSQQPSPVQLTSADIGWCVGDSTGHCAGFINSGATISASGVANCNSGFAGTVTVLAGRPTTGLNPVPDTGFQLSVFGTAQLTCP